MEITRSTVYVYVGRSGEYTGPEVPGVRTHMVSDEELKQHIRTAEREHEHVAPVSARMEEMETTARSVHNELARRIEAVDQSSPDCEEIADIREDMDELERRLDAIEAQLD